MKWNNLTEWVSPNAIMQSRFSYENLGSSSSHSWIFISTINVMNVFLSEAIFWSIRQPGEARPDYLRCRHYGGMNSCRKREKGNEKLELFLKDMSIREGFYETTQIEILRHVLCTAGSGRKTGLFAKHCFWREKPLKIFWHPCGVCWEDFSKF